MGIFKTGDKSTHSTQDSGFQHEDTVVAHELFRYPSKIAYIHTDKTSPTKDTCGCTELIGAEAYSTHALQTRWYACIFCGFRIRAAFHSFMITKKEIEDLDA